MMMMTNKRFNNCSGIKGRWKILYVNIDKIINLDDEFKEILNKLNDFTISPGIRQTLQHWVYFN